MKNRMNALIRNLIVLLLVATGSSLYARKAIEVTLDDGTPTTIGFTSLDDAIESIQNDPTSLYGGSYDPTDDYTANVDIMGFDLDLSLTGNSVQYSFTDADGNLITRTFTGTSREDALDQLEAFFESDAGQQDFTKYMEAVQAQALFNFVTGPESSVGQSVRDNTKRAMGPSLTTEEQSRLAKSGSNFSIGVEYTEFDSGEFSGKSYTVPIEVGGRFGSWGSLLFRMPLNFTDLEGTEFYRLGMELDLGIKLMGHAPASPFEWEITPTVGNYFMGTADLLIGGDIYNYGVQNRFQMNAGPVSLSYGAYYGKYESTEISLGDVDVDLNVDDTVISHGLKLAYRIGSFMVIDGYLINSRPEDGGGYSEIETIGGSINLRAGPAVFRIGYAQDEGKDTRNKDHEADRLIATLLFRF